MTVYVYTCPLCKELITARMLEPLNAATKRDFAVRVSQYQMAHVQQRHPEIFQRLMDLSGQYSLALFQKLFLTTDAALIALRDEILDCAEKTITGEWNYLAEPAAPKPPTLEA